MRSRLERVGQGFWNLRTDFRVLRLLNIGTHASLVQLRSGAFVMLDACPLAARDVERISELTGGKKGLDAIINLHPFHTVFVPEVARQFPAAKLYGTRRHHRVAPELEWQPEVTESPEFAALFADDLEFRVPAGVALIPENEHLHFSSVLAIHADSQTLHVDDTLNATLPLLAWTADARCKLRFHPALRRVLLPEPGAARAFGAWADALIERSADLRNVCTAHASRSGLRDAPPGRIAAELRAAKRSIDRVLRTHDSTHR